MLNHQTECLCDIPEIVGPYGWGIIHHAFESFPCPPCAETGGRLGRGVHDVVNFHIGKSLEHPEDLEFLREAVQAVPPLQNLTPDSPLDREIVRLAGEANMDDVPFPRCSPSERKTFERCVQQVKKQGSADSPQAVCTVSIGCSPRSRSK